MANPLTFIIEQAREVLIWGHLPNWMDLGIYTLVATVFALAAYAWFQKTRKGFDERNLRYMRAFFQGFPIWNAVRTGLSWTHYRNLLREENEQARN